MKRIYCEQVLAIGVAAAAIGLRLVVLACISNAALLWYKLLDEKHVTVVNPSLCGYGQARSVVEIKKIYHLPRFWARGAVGKCGLLDDRVLHAAAGASPKNTFTPGFPRLPRVLERRRSARKVCSIHSPTTMDDIIIVTIIVIITIIITCSHTVITPLQGHGCQLAFPHIFSQQDGYTRFYLCDTCMKISVLSYYRFKNISTVFQMHQQAHGGGLGADSKTVARTYSVPDNVN